MTTGTKIDWKQVLAPSIVAILFFTALTGVLYPALITGIAQTAFSHQANGSLITSEDGSVMGSELIGQQFDNPAYFWSRPSATGSFPYNASASSGSNLGPLNPALIGPEGSIQMRIDALVQANADAGVPSLSLIPVDLVTASASGLDPHISPAAAEYQLARVAALRGVDTETLRRLVEHYTDGRMFIVLGEPRVHVLSLNLALDAQYPLRDA